MSVKCLLVYHEESSITLILKKIYCLIKLNCTECTEMGIHNNNLINMQPNQYYFSQFPDINDYKMVKS